MSCFTSVVHGNDTAHFVDQYKGRGMLICHTVTGQWSVQSFDFIPLPVIGGIRYGGAFLKAVIFGCTCIFWKICTVLFGEEKPTTENNVGSIFSLT